MPVILNKRQTAYIFLILTMAIWGIATPVVKATVHFVPPFTFLMLRFLISALILLPFAIYYSRKIKIDRERWKHIAIAAIIGQVLALSFLFMGIGKTQAVDAAVIGTILPVITSILGFFILREIITKREIEGTLIAFIGALVIIIEPVITGHKLFNGERIQVIGNLLVFFGVIMDSIYPIYNKKYLSADSMINPFMQISYGFIIAALIYIPLGISEQYHLYKSNSESIPICTLEEVDEYTKNANITCDETGCFTLSDEYFCKISTTADMSFSHYLSKNIFSYLSSKALYGIFYMAVFSGIVAYFLYLKGLKAIEASEASVFQYLQPLFAIPISIIFLGEQVSSVFVLGAVIIGIGIYLVERR